MSEFNVQQYGLKENPFLLDIIPETLVGYEKERNALLQALKLGEKHILITGMTGAGKTTLSLWIKKNFENVIYLPKPPYNEDELMEIIKRNIVCKGIVNRIKCFTKHIDKYNIAEHIKNKRFIMLIDEAHETSREVLEWSRTLIDQIKGATIIYLSLPSFSQRLENELETLKQRIALEIQLNRLTKDETYQLIKARIEYYGGRDIAPFTPSFVEKVYEISGGFPREIIKLCDKALQKAIQEKAMIVNESFLNNNASSFSPHIEEKKEEKEEKPAIQEYFEITDKQREILKLIKKHNYLTPPQIVELIDVSEYSSKVHALRAINNLLRRLELMNLVAREKRGRKYAYYLTSKAKTLLTEK